MELRDFCEVKDWIAAITGLERRIATQTGLTLNHACTLCCLGRGQRHVSELANELKISRPSLSRLLKPLLSRGLITQVHTLSLAESPRDGRQKYLCLTPEGERIYSDLVQHEKSWFPLSIITTNRNQVLRTAAEG